MDNKRALSSIPKLWIYVERYVSGRGAFYLPVKQIRKLLWRL